MLQLPATPEQLLRLVIEPALRELPEGMDSIRARGMLLAIARQESNLEHWRQVAPGGSPGPGRGPWQFEQNGGTAGVLNHHATRAIAEQVCRDHGIRREPRAAHLAMERPENALFACKFARLLLWTHPEGLPALEPEAEEYAFGYYEWLWRPGAHNTPVGRARARARWAGAWPEAIEAAS